jgi:hypothetical protein
LKGSIRTGKVDVMKRFSLVSISALALLVPTLTFAQVQGVYIPGAHPRVVVVPSDKETSTTKVERAPMTPTQVIARHEAMAAARRAHSRVDYSAVAHCDRLITEARKQVRASF